MRRAGARAPQASSITLAIALLFPVGASAAEYLVSNETELRSAIDTANLNGDATATIRLTSSFSITGATVLPTPTMPLTIDTQGFVLSRGGAGAFVAPATGALVFDGTYAADAAAAGIRAIVVTGGGEAILNGNATGADATVAGTAGGVAVSVQLSGTRFTNNGAVKGGTSLAFATANTGNGAGVVLQSANTTLTNSATGVITGGDSVGGLAGPGVYSNVSNTAIVNEGTIRGGSDLNGGTGGGRAIHFSNAVVTATVENSGLLEGGVGAPAISGGAPVTRITVINSGTIRAGAGATNAITFVGNSSGASANTLELRAGSNIIGIVQVNQASVNDTFRLGGATDSVFDVSTIGDTAQYRFFDKFEKTGASTWSLTGDGTVTAPWTIDEGTLQIGNGGTSGSLAGDVTVNAGANLAFNRADSYTYGNVISGAGSVAQNGTGTTVLTAANTYTGATTINLGTLAVDGSITSPVTVNAAGTLSGTGTIFGNVTNAGTVTPGGGSGVLTVAGNYIGNGGTVRLNTVFGGDNSATGRLVVTGDTSGTSQIRPVHVGGGGAATVEGIKLIDVQGASNGTFTLAGDYTFQGQQAIVAGPYAYRLVKNGVSTPTDGDWYLRSTLAEAPAAGSSGAAVNNTPLLAPTVPLYEAYASVLQRFNELGTLQQRVGNRSWSQNASVQAEQDAGKPIIGRGAWARVEGSNTHIDPSTSTTGSSYNVRMWKFEGGVDAPVVQNSAGTLVVGPTFHYGIANSSVSSMLGNGAVDATGYGFGGTATWYGNNGSYVDARATLTWYDTDIRSSTLSAKLANGNRGSGVATSVEAGHQLALGGNWSITPQAQLSWSQVRFDAFTDQYGANVSRDNGNSLVSRLGISLDHETKWTAANGKTSRSHVYGITNLYYDFLHGTSTRVADISVVNKEQALWAGLGIGASMNWNDDRYTVYGELLARTSVENFGDSNAIGAKLGVRYRW